MPVDNSDDSDAAQRNGFVTRYNYVGTGQGTVIRITEFAPGAPKFMHRTETVDYALLLSGECDLELDSGEVAHLKAGDIVVQRGTMHAWVNNGTAPCVFAFILIDAEPANVAGQELRTHFPAPSAIHPTLGIVRGTGPRVAGHAPAARCAGPRRARFRRVQ